MLLFKQAPLVHSSHSPHFLSLFFGSSKLKTWNGAEDVLSTQLQSHCIPLERAELVLPTGGPQSPRVRWLVRVSFFRKNRRQSLTKDWRQNQNCSVRTLRSCNFLNLLEMQCLKLDMVFLVQPYCREGKLLPGSVSTFQVFLPFF